MPRVPKNNCNGTKTTKAKAKGGGGQGCVLVNPATVDVPKTSSQRVQYKKDCANSIMEIMLLAGEKQRKASKMYMTQRPRYHMSSLFSVGSRAAESGSISIPMPEISRGPSMRAVMDSDPFGSCSPSCYGLVDKGPQRSQSSSMMTTTTTATRTTRARATKNMKVKDTRSRVVDRDGDYDDDEGKEADAGATAARGGAKTLFQDHIDRNDPRCAGCGSGHGVSVETLIFSNTRPFVVLCSQCTDRG
jgi:hypothetical protein